MKVFSVSRIDRIGYDEYDCHVVAADSEEEVVSILDGIFRNTPEKTGQWWADGDKRAVYVIEEVTTKGLVVSSFNAG